MKLRILTFALALLLFAGVLCGCRKNTGNEEKATDAFIGEKDYGSVGEKDWQGRTCQILGVNSLNEPSFEIYADSNEQTNISMSVFSRNSEIEALFNVEIAQVGDDDYNDEFYTKFKNKILTGAVSYDLAFLYRDDMAKAIENQLFYDLMGVNYVDFSQPYYNESTLESMKISGKLFHMVSDFSLVDKNRIAVLFANRTLAEEFGIPNLVQEVKDGTWTFEKFEQYVKEVAADLDGDDQRLYTKDRFGVTIGAKDESIAFWSAMGAKTVSRNDAGQYEFTYSNQLALNAADRIKRVFTNEDLYYYSRVEDNYEGAGDAFKAGRSLFYGASLSSITGIKESDFAYTVLPFPKYDEDQDRYYSNNNNRYCATFGIPTCAQDKDFSGFMIEVLSWKSTQTTLRTYYQINCKLRNSYDQECSDMMDVLFESLSFDFGFMYDPVFTVENSTPKSIVSTALRHDDGQSLSTAYESYSESQEIKLKQLLKKILTTAR